MNMAKKLKKKKKRVLSGRFVWLILFLIAIIFMVIIFGLKMIPDLWKWIVLGIMIIALLLTGVLSSRYYKNRFIKFVDIVLCLVLAAGSFLIPHYENKISSLFDYTGGNTATIRLYVLSDEYRAAHPELYSAYSVSEELSDYFDSVFITTMGIDYDNQNFALTELKNTAGHEMSTVNCVNAVESAQYLYEGQGEVLVLADAFVSMITETEGYEHFENDTKVIGSFKRTIETNVAQSDTTLTDNPFVIFIGGNDEEGELTVQCKTDVAMIVAVNPLTHQIALVSYPRDSYIPNPAYGAEAYDKLTHLGFSGIDNTMTGLNQYMNLGDVIDNYITINFRTYMNIIDALGGVDVDNPYAFGFWDNPNIWFEQGPIHLDGYNSLLYVRERKTLPDGDFGRTMHQQLVLKAIINKLTSPEVITHFNDLLSALSGTFLTNLSSDSIYALCRKQLSENISWNIVNYHVTGDTGFSSCVSAGGEELSVVYPYDDQVEFVAQVIRNVMAGRIVSQEEMPVGTYYTY